jgi:hypothetical protein
LPAGATNLQGVKRLVMLAAGLTLFVPVLHWEVALVNNLNAALGAHNTVSAPSVDVNVPHTLPPLIHALDR